MGKIKKAVLNGHTVYVEVAELAFAAGPSAVGAGRPGEQALELSDELKDSIVGYFGAMTKSFTALEEELRPIAEPNTRSRSIPEPTR